MPLTPGVNSSSYIGSVALLKDREIAEQVADLYEDNDWIKLFLGEGKTKVTTQEEYSSAINSPLNALSDTTGATITNSATTQITIAYTAGNSGKLIEGKLARFPNGNVGRIMSIATSAGVDTVIIKSVDANTLTATAGNKLSIFGNAQEEGGRLVAPERRLPSFIGNKVQIMKRAVEMTDIRKGEKITIRDKATGNMMGNLNSAQIEALQAHEADIAFTMLMGRLSTTSFGDASPGMVGPKGYGIQTTRGLDAYIEQYGINDAVASLGTVTAADFDDFIAQLTAARSGKSIALIGAIAPVLKISNFWKNVGGSGYGAGRMSLNGREIDLSVEKIIYGDFNMTLGGINFLGNTDYVDPASDIAKSVFVLPMGKVPTVDGGSIDYWRTRFMNVDGPGKGTMLIAEHHYGKLATPSNGTDAVHGIEFQSILGLEVTAPHKFGKLQVLA